MSKRRESRALGSMHCTTRCTEKTYFGMRTPAARPMVAQRVWTKNGSRTSRRTGRTAGSVNWRNNSRRRPTNHKRFDESIYRSRAGRGCGPCLFRRMIRDRTVQTATRLVLEPIFEADLPDEQYGYRPERDALAAVVRVHRLLSSGYTHVVDADLSAYFDTVPLAELLRSVARRVVDRTMLHLLKMWLVTPVEESDERGRKKRTARNRDEHRGAPQGSPLSPLLSNVYMRRFVLGWKRLGHEKRLGAHIVSYADDLVICCKGPVPMRHCARCGPS